jgi:hypothetical protein
LRGSAGFAPASLFFSTASCNFQTGCGENARTHVKAERIYMPEKVGVKSPAVEIPTRMAARIATLEVEERRFSAALETEETAGFSPWILRHLQYFAASFWVRLIRRLFTQELAHKTQGIDFLLQAP